MCVCVHLCALLIASACKGPRGRRERLPLVAVVAAIVKGAVAVAVGVAATVAVREAVVVQAVERSPVEVTHGPRPHQRAAPVPASVLMIKDKLHKKTSFILSAAMF